MNYYNEIKNKLKSNEFERLPLSTRNKLAKEAIAELKDIVPILCL